MTEYEFFESNASGHTIYRAVKRAIAGLEGVESRISKSQIGFYRQHPFASVWQPDRYLKGEQPPLVLTVFLRRRDPSKRWKEVVEPKPGRFTHHLELGAADEVDAEVHGWLREAWGEAG